MVLKKKSGLKSFLQDRSWCFQNPDDPDATKRFQDLSEAYTYLSRTDAYEDSKKDITKHTDLLHAS